MRYPTMDATNPMLEMSASTITPTGRASSANSAPLMTFSGWGRIVEPVMVLLLPSVVRPQTTRASLPELWSAEAQVVAEGGRAQSRPAPAEHGDSEVIPN